MHAARIVNTFLCFEAAEEESRAKSVPPSTRLARFERRVEPRLSARSLDSWTAHLDAVSSRRMPSPPRPMCLPTQSASAAHTASAAETTVMMKNLSKDQSVATVFDLLVKNGFDGHFDYLYVPMGLGGKRTDAERTFECYGFAFVNFTSPEAASAFKERCWGSQGKKPLQVLWARVQGAQENLREFYLRAAERSMPVNSVDTCRPWLFSGSAGRMCGQAVPAP
mmetsp:Transcript_23397/g.51482  ORF Transcript_23397/g.51482 Transcript_23397/m.51482 type:complete len:223 (-) Transcript_23397:443-1111(-)